MNSKDINHHLLAQNKHLEHFIAFKFSIVLLSPSNSVTHLASPWYLIVAENHTYDEII